MDPAAEAAIGAGNDVLTADDCGIPQNAVGNELRVLDKVGGMADDARHQHFADQQLRLLPHAPLMLVPHVGGVEGIGVRLHLEDPACRIRDIAMPRRHPCGVDDRPFLVSRLHNIGSSAFASGRPMRRTAARRCRPGRMRQCGYALPRRTQQPVELGVEARAEKRIAELGEMQLIRRDRRRQASIAVELHLADFCKIDVLAVAAVADQLVDLGYLKPQRGARRLLAREKAKEQDPSRRETLAQNFKIGADAICRELRRSAIGEIVGSDEQHHCFWLWAGEIAVLQPPQKVVGTIPAHACVQCPAGCQGSFPYLGVPALGQGIAEKEDGVGGGFDCLIYPLHALECTRIRWRHRSRHFFPRKFCAT